MGEEEAMSASGGMGKLVRPSFVRYRFSPIAAELEGLRACFGRLLAAFFAPPPVGACPVCGTDGFRVVSRERLPHMGELGAQELTIQCENAECRHREVHMHGYRPAEA
jgi:hypothetical protein